MRSHYRAVGNSSVSLGHFQSVISKPCKYWLPEKTKKAPYRAVLGKKVLFSDRTGWHIEIRRSRTFLGCFFLLCIPPLIARSNDAMVLCNGHWATFVQNMKTKTNQTRFKKHNPCMPLEARPLIFFSVSCKSHRLYKFDGKMIKKLLDDWKIADNY